MSYKLRYWLLFHFFISIGLLCYSFSYWQDTGLGDYPSLPIGYGQRIYSPDFAWTSFYPDLKRTEPNKDEIIIGNFIVKNNFLCAEVSHRRSDSPKFDFIVCNLANTKNETFLNEEDYNEFAKTKNLPIKKEFYSFETHYTEYLQKKPKWKKWLLP